MTLLRRRLIRQADLAARTVTIQQRMYLGARVETKRAALAKLAKNPYAIEAMLRAAMQETFVKAFRERFLKHLARAVAMEVDGKQKPQIPTTERKEKGYDGKYRESYLARALDTLKKYEQSYFSLDARHTRQRMHARQNVAHARERYMDAVMAKRKHRGKSSIRRSFNWDRKTKQYQSMHESGFRRLALEILAMVVPAVQPTWGRMMPQATSGGAKGAGAGGPAMIRLGVGSLAQIEGVKTPSFKSTTPSRYNTLWRHLEFGTGIYRSDKSVNAASPYRTERGGWWYGHSEGYSLHLLGSRPMGALRNPRTQLPYTGDALRFRSIFAARMHKLLNG